MTERGREADPRLRVIHVFAIGAGAMFSSGFFLLPGVAAAETGPSLPLAYLLAGLLVLPTMVAVTELAVAMPRAGGPYHFVRRSMGPMTATVGGVGLWVALVLKAAFALEGIDAYLGLLVDLPAGVVGLALAVVFTVVNLAGARESAVVQVWLVGVLLLILGAFIAVGALRAAEPDAEALADRFDPLFTDGVLGLLAATAIVFVAFAGLPQVASVAADIENPSHAIPRGVLAALGIATTVYVLGTAVVVANVTADDLRGDATPIATAAERLAVPGAVSLIVIAGLAAFASTGNAGIMAAARYPLALAEGGVVWRRFANLNSSGVPVTGVIVSGIAVALVVGLLDVEGIAKIGSAFVLMSFGMMNAAVIVLRHRRVPDYTPSFRTPWVPWLPAFGVLSSVVLVIDLGPVPVAAVVGVAGLAALWHGWARREADDDPGALTWPRRRTPTDADTHPVVLEDVEVVVEKGSPETLAAATVVRIAPDATGADVEQAAAAALAERVGVDASRVAEWLAGRRHPVLETDEAVLHLVPLDGPLTSSVVLAWSPALDGTGRRRARIAAVIASSDPGSEPDRRLFGLVAAQLADEALHRRWPADNDSVAQLLSTDATRRLRSARDGITTFADPPQG
ncbi:MAG: APC family permease [Acidimicrobiales bacterium]